MCKKYDSIASAKEKNPKGNVQHPLSPEQKRRNMENQVQQKLNKNVNHTNNDANYGNVNKKDDL